MKQSECMQREKYFFRVFRQEFRRSICSGRFLVGVLLTLVWMILNAIHEAPNYELAVWSGAPYLFDKAVDGSLYIGPVVLTIATLPNSSTYLYEQQCGYMQQAVVRVGLSAYSESKAWTTALVSFLMAVIGMAVFLVILCAMQIPHVVRYESVKGFYLEIVHTLGPGWYYVVKIATLGLSCSLSAEFALMITSWIPNEFVGFLSPLVGCYLICCILELLAPLNRSSTLWRLVDPTALFFSQVVPGNNYFSILWATTFLVILIASCGYEFERKLRKEQMQ